MGAIGVKCSNLGSLVSLSQIYYGVLLRCAFAFTDGGAALHTEQSETIIVALLTHGCHLFCGNGLCTACV